MGAKLKQRLMQADRTDLDPREATRAAREHSEVLEAAARIRRYLVKRGYRVFDGHRPEDPRRMLTDPQYIGLVRQRDEAFERARAQFMGRETLPGGRSAAS